MHIQYVHFKLKSFYKNRLLCHAGITKRSFPYTLESNFISVANVLI